MKGLETPQSFPLYRSVSRYFVGKPPAVFLNIGIHTILFLLASVEMTHIAQHTYILITSSKYDYENTGYYFSSQYGKFPSQ